jgi:hypothetical protein
MAYVAKLSSAGGVKSLTRYVGVLAGNTVWNPYDASGYEPIAVTTVPSGGLASISFGSIPQTYTHLQLRWLARGSSAAGLYIRFNGDTAGKYARNRISGDGSAVSSSGLASQSQIYTVASWGIPTAASTFAGGVYEILDYANTNKNTTLRGLAGQDSSGSGGVELISGLWVNAAAVNAIDISLNTGNFQQYTQFALYGIKG